MSISVRFISEVFYRNTFNPTTKGLTFNEPVVATFIERKRQVVHATIKLDQVVEKLSEN
jgi:hypothetical protein